MKDTQDKYLTDFSHCVFLYCECVMCKNGVKVNKNNDEWRVSGLTLGIKEAHRIITDKDTSNKPP